MADMPQKAATAQLAALGTEPNKACYIIYSLHLYHRVEREREYLRLTIYRTPPIPKPAPV